MVHKLKPEVKVEKIKEKSKVKLKTETVEMKPVEKVKTESKFEYEPKEPKLEEFVKEEYTGPTMPCTRDKCSGSMELQSRNGFEQIFKCPKCGAVTSKCS